MILELTLPIKPSAYGNVPEARYFINPTLRYACVGLLKWRLSEAYTVNQRNLSKKVRFRWFTNKK